MNRTLLSVAAGVLTLGLLAAPAFAVDPDRATFHATSHTVAATPLIDDELAKIEGQATFILYDMNSGSYLDITTAILIENFYFTVQFDDINNYSPSATSFMRQQGALEFASTRGR